MFSNFLSVEHGLISIEGELLPSTVESMTVKGALVFADEEIDNKSGKQKTPKGFEDADLLINMLLLSDETSTCYDKLEEINDIFTQTDENAGPLVYTVVSAHVASRGISEVYFAGLESRENNDDDTVTVVLKMIEFEPVMTAKEKNQPVAVAGESSGAPVISPIAAPPLFPGFVS